VDGTGWTAPRRSLDGLIAASRTGWFAVHRVAVAQVFVGDPVGQGRVDVFVRADATSPAP
jgi:hypothetical protein